MNDEQIVELYWQRDESAIQETCAKYGAYCMTVAENILSCREDCEECVNDTWLRAWNAIPPQKPEILRLFLAKITRNLSLDRWKAKAAAKRGRGEIDLALEELGECLAGSMSVEDTVSGKELAGSVNQFMLKLPEREADIFLRRYFFVEPVAAIAGRYGMKESNVLVILSRTRRKLKIHLEKEGYLT